MSCIQSHLRVLHYIDVLQHSRGNNKFKTCKEKMLYLIRKHQGVMLLDCREEMKVDWTCISNKSIIPRNSWYQRLLVFQYLSKKDFFYMKHTIRFIPTRTTFNFFWHWLQDINFIKDPYFINHLLLTIQFPKVNKLLKNFVLDWTLLIVLCV